MVGITSTGFETQPAQWLRRPNKLTLEDDQCWPLVDSRSCWVSEQRGQSPWEPSSLSHPATSETPTTVTPQHTEPVWLSQCLVVSHHTSSPRYEPWGCLVIVSNVKILLCKHRQLWGHCSSVAQHCGYFNVYGHSSCYVIFLWYIVTSDIGSNLHWLSKVFLLWCT